MEKRCDLQVGIQANVLEQPRASGEGYQPRANQLSGVERRLPGHRFRFDRTPSQFAVRHEHAEHVLDDPGAEQRGRLGDIVRRGDLDNLHTGQTFPSNELEQPKSLPAGSKITVTTYFDNSPNNKYNPAPEKTVWWSEQSWDEMYSPQARITLDNRDLRKPAPMPTAQQQQQQ